MQQITIRVPKRANGADPFTVEWHEWRSGSLQGVRPRKRKIPAEPMIPGEPPGGLTLAELATFLHGPTSAAQIQLRGRQLHNAFCGGPWNDLWKGLATECRIYLCIEDPALGDIPWEIWSDGEPLALRKGHTLIRASVKEPRPAPTLEPRPWKTLILVGVGPGADDNIGARDEAARLKRHLLQFDHSFDCMVVDAGQRDLYNFADLETLFSNVRPDIFHFIGHGESTPAGSRLLIHSSVNKWPWDTTQITLTLKGAGAKLRLAYLNGCRTKNSVGLGDPMLATSVSEAFLQGGTLAVIAMQADVDGKLAASSAHRFYEEMVSGRTIDEALQSGRRGLGTLESPAFLPTLSTAYAVETVLPPRPPMSAARAFAVQGCSKMTEAATILDRDPVRRNIIEKLLQSDARGRSYSAALLEGSPAAGKTAFVCWMLRMCAWQMVPAFYAEPPQMKRAEDCNWLEYIRSICRGNTKLGALAPPLPDAARSQFYWDLNRIVSGAEPPYGAPPDSFTDPGVSLQSLLTSGRAGNELEQRILASFHNALKLTAGGCGTGTGKVVLICDQWREALGVGGDDFAALKRGLFDPVAQDPTGPVRLIITRSDGDDRYRQVEFDHNWIKGSIALFDEKDTPELMAELVERRHPDESTDFEWLKRPPSKAIYPQQFVDRAEWILTLRRGHE